MINKNRRKATHIKWRKKKGLNISKKTSLWLEEFEKNDKIILPLLEEEIFKQYKGRWVSNFGRVFNRYGEPINVGETSWGGYHYISNEKKSRIVYTLFKGEIPEGLVINHIDGNKSNDHINNLEAITMGENNKHAIKIGLRKPFKKYSDEQCILVYELMMCYKSDTEISKIVNIPTRVICHLRKGYKLGSERTKIYNRYKDKIPKKSPFFQISRENLINIFKDVYHTNMSINDISEKNNITYSVAHGIKNNKSWNYGIYLELRTLVQNNEI